MAENKPTHRKHNPWHNYSKKCIYHITLVVKDRAAVLGHLVEVREEDSSTICPWAHLHPKGQVLLLVPSELPHIDRKGKIARAECVALNERAKEIVNE